MSHIKEQAKPHDTNTYRNETYFPSSGYDLPFGMTVIRRLTFLRHIPISPTYGTHSSNSVTKPTTEAHVNEGYTDVAIIA